MKKTHELWITFFKSDNTYLIQLFENRFSCLWELCALWNIPETDFVKTLETMQDYYNVDITDNDVSVKYYTSEH